MWRTLPEPSSQLMPKVGDILPEMTAGVSVYVIGSAWEL